MKPFNIQLFETFIILVIYIISYFVYKNLINNFLKKTRLERGRRKMTIKAFQFLQPSLQSLFLQVSGVLNKMKLPYLQVLF